MSNKKVSCKANISYTDADNQNATLPLQLLEPEYLAQTHGNIDVPATTVAGSFVIPFGAVTNATCVLIENKLDQPVNVSVNSGDLAYDTLAVGKSFLLALPMAIAGAPVTAVSVTTLDTEAADGSIVYHIWGDPA